MCNHTWILRVLQGRVFTLWHMIYISRGPLFHCQKHYLEYPCSAGGTKFYMHHTQPFYHLPRASGRSYEGLLTGCAWHQQSYAHQPQGSEKGYISPSNLPSAALLTDDCTWSCTGHYHCICKCYGKDSTIRAVWLPPNVHYPDCKLLGMTQHKAGDQLQCRTGNRRVHAIVHIDHSVTASYAGNSTPVTASNMDDLHKFPSQNLERETLDLAGQLHECFQKPHELFIVCNFGFTTTVVNASRVEKNHDLYECWWLVCTSLLFFIFGLEICQRFPRLNLVTWLTLYCAPTSWVCGIQ